MKRELDAENLPAILISPCALDACLSSRSIFLRIQNQNASNSYLQGHRAIIQRSLYRCNMLCYITATATSLPAQQFGQAQTKCPAQACNISHGSHVHQKMSCHWSKSKIETAIHRCYIDVRILFVYLVTFPYCRIWFTLILTVSIGIAKPIPELVPLLE